LFYVHLRTQQTAACEPSTFSAIVVLPERPHCALSYIRGYGEHADPMCGTVRSRHRFRRKYRVAHSQTKLKRKDAFMTINLGLTPLVSLIAGILILVMPRLLNYIVAFYLIIIGVIGLFGGGNYHF
jgi:hypothetical protein